MALMLQYELLNAYQKMAEWEAKVKFKLLPVVAETLCSIWKQLSTKLGIEDKIKNNNDNKTNKIWE